VVLVHSTKTVPLNLAGPDGRWTTMRVVYGCEDTISPTVGRGGSLRTVGTGMS